MIYASIDDFKKALPEHFLASVAYGDDGLLDAGRMQSSIDAAVSEINGYLARPYNLPFTATKNERLKDLTVDITAYKLARDYGALNEDIRKRYEDAIKYLGLVASGKAFLPEPLYLETDEGGEVDNNQASRGKPNIQSNARLFTRDSLKDY